MNSNSKLGQTLPIIFCLGVFFTIAFQSHAQTHQKSISVAVFNEHITDPFQDRNYPIQHLGASLSIEFSKKREGTYRPSNVLQLGYYYHQDFHQVGFVAIKPKFSLYFFDVISLHTILGIGYAHSFPTHQRYTFNNGTYTEAGVKSKGHLMPSLGLGAGFHLDELLEAPLELFVRYELFSLAPYAPKESLPLTINTMLSFGAKFTLD